MVGDGFGGRLWYTPYNYTVGSYSGYTTCGDSSQLYAWGHNLYGQLGNGSTISSNTPVKSIGMTNVKYYSTGYCMGVIKKDGSAWAFGKPFSNTPTKVMDSAVFVDAGAFACNFIRSDGTVWSVGTIVAVGSFGIGSPVRNTYFKPIQMLGITTAVRVANGYYTSLVLLKDSTMMVCGNNNACGLGSSSNYKPDTFLVPKKIYGLKRIVDIKATMNTNIALTDSGDVYYWGNNSTCTPFKILQGKNIVAISGANDGYHFMALDANHNCYAWGNNYWGQIGNGNTTQVNTPVIVATNVNDIMAGESFSYLVKKDGSLWACGKSNASSGSIWMNLKDTARYTFTKINPTASPMLLCSTKPITSQEYVTTKICEGDTFWRGSSFITQDSMFSDTFHLDKSDSIVNSQIVFLLKDRQSEIHNLCEGSVFMGKIYTSSNSFKDTFTNENGCDSIVTHIVNVIRHSKQNIKQTICQGESFTVGSNYYYNSGTYIDTIVNAGGCDSIITTVLKVNPKSNSSRTVTVCDGDTFRYNGKLIISQTTVSDTLFNDYGCDSVETVSVLFTQKIESYNQGMICIGDTFKIGKSKYIYPGNYIDTIKSVFGCDSIVHMVLEHEECGYTLYNVFTPGNDEFNNTYEITGEKGLVYNIQIYDRWGVLIYSVQNAAIADRTKFWNGKVNNTGTNCPSGTYYYIFNAKGEEKTINGIIQLIR